MRGPTLTVRSVVASVDSDALRLRRSPIAGLRGRLARYRRTEDSLVRSLGGLTALSTLLTVPTLLTGAVPRVAGRLATAGDVSVIATTAGFTLLCAIVTIAARCYRAVSRRRIPYSATDRVVADEADVELRLETDADEVTIEPASASAHGEAAGALRRRGVDVRTPASAA